MINPNTHISIVIATRDRILNLFHTLNQLYTLPERPHIIIVDNGSSDGTSKEVRLHYPQITAISLSKNLGPAGRNLGVQHANCPCVAFSDDDSWWAPGSLAKAAGLFDSYPKLALIASRIFVGQEQRLYPICKEMSNGKLPAIPDCPGFPILGFISCRSIVLRSAYLATGGFETHFGIGGEENLLAMDLAAHGWHLAYIEDIVLYHHPSPIRNRNNRRRNEVRNTLLTAWLRRPVSIALLKTLSLLKPTLHDPHTRAGLFDALKRLDWIIQSRQLVPKHVELALRILENGTK